MLVDDDAIVRARSRLWAEHRIVVELGAAAAFAALEHLEDGAAGRVAVVLCGANTDPADLTGDAPAETVRDLSQGV